MPRPDILDQPWVHTRGAGEPAVLVHGVYPGSPESFAAQQPLAEAFTLITVDRRGYGGNPDHGGQLGWPADAEDLLHLLDVVGGAHLVGHSYGGVVVGLAAGRRPDLVRSLTLVDPSLHSVAADDPAVAAMTAAERKVADVAASPATTREWARTWMVEVVGADPAGADRFLDHWRDADWAMLEIVRREAPATAAPVDYDALAKATFPKILVVGASPPPTAPATDRASRLRDALVDGITRRIGARAVVFERSTHFPPSEEPERFNRLLRATWTGRG
jgi:pimeloyl-ACP methyl ester carboxylesterase